MKLKQIAKRWLKAPPQSYGTFSLCLDLRSASRKPSSFNDPQAPPTKEALNLKSLHLKILFPEALPDSNRAVLLQADKATPQGLTLKAFHVLCGPVQ